MSSSDSLDEIERIASSLGASEIATDVAELAERLSEGLFYVACVGQFKRGKSTLINALVGQPLLPTGVTPVTAVITIVRWGSPTRATVHFDDGHEESIGANRIVDYVTEERNPGNSKAARAVEVFVPSGILAGGLCLVDTPGLGSVFRQNTEVTEAFVPHIDAALVVVGADPPISGDEAGLARAIGEQTRYTIVVVNKADRLPDADVDAAVAFTRRALESALPGEPELLVVSAVKRVDGRTTRDWERLERNLCMLAEQSGGALLRASRQRGLRRIQSRLRDEIAIRRNALTKPFEAFERSVVALRHASDDARQTLRDLTHLFASDQRTLAARFEEERERFLARAIPELIRRVDEETDGWRHPRQEIIRVCQRIADAEVHAWLVSAETEAEKAYARAMERYERLVSDFMARVAATGIESSGMGQDPNAIDRTFRVPRRYYFHELWQQTQRLPYEWLVDVVLTGGIRRRRVAREGRRFARTLLEINATRVVNDFDERVRESRRFVEREIAARIAQIAGAAERGLEEARSARAAGSERVAAEIERLDRAASLVAAVALEDPTGLAAHRS